MTYDVALCHLHEITNLILSHPDDLAILRKSSGWLMDIAGCHPDNLRYYPNSSGRHNVISTLSHLDALDPDRISSGWLMAGALCHPGDLPCAGISSGWLTANSLCHPDDTPFHLMSSGRLNLARYLIPMNYGNVIMSSGWDTLSFLSHPDDRVNFDFPQHAVALQRFRRYVELKVKFKVVSQCSHTNYTNSWFINELISNLLYFLQHIFVDHHGLFFIHHNFHNFQSMDCSSKHYHQGPLLLTWFNLEYGVVNKYIHSWWRHQMETFSALLAICVWNSPVPGEFHAQRPVTWSFGVSFDLRLHKRLSKQQSWGWWF